MEDTSTNNDIPALCQKARELGASQAVALPAADIVLDERAALKCLVPLCSHYGVDLTCPPVAISSGQFREMLSRYQEAILIKLDIPNESLPGQGNVERDLVNLSRESRLKLHEIVSRLESLCIEKGYYFAAGLIGGSCPLCDKCVGVKSGLPCRHPFKARPAMEAMGIDVIATARNASLRLGFGRDEGRSWMGLVLVS